VEDFPIFNLMVSQQIKIPNWFVVPAFAGTYYLKYLQVPGFQLMGNDNILQEYQI